jgi:hypothetical protein
MRGAVAGKAHRSGPHVVLVDRGLDPWSDARLERPDVGQFWREDRAGIVRFAS